MSEIHSSLIDSYSASIKWISITLAALWVSPAFTQLGNATIQLAVIGYIIPFLMVLSWLSFRLLSKATGLLDWKTAIAGWIFIVGGVLFDVGATIYHSPDLSMESNPIALLLFKHGFRVTSVYLYGIAAQALLIIWACILWSAFLCHRTFWLDNVMLMKPSSFASFFRFCFAGRPLGLIDFLIPFGKKRAKKSYFCFWFIIPFFLGMFLQRWLLGLHWFNLLSEIPDAYGTIIGALAAYAIFFVWLYLEYRKRSKKTCCPNLCPPLSCDSSRN